MTRVLTIFIAGALVLRAQESGAAQQIARLEAAFAAQQKQIENLERALERQQQLLETALSQGQKPASVAPVALAPVALRTAPAPQPPASSPASPVNPCEARQEGESDPPYLRIGGACAIPVGFMDLTAVWRDKAAGTSLGTNFGSIPY